jgi:hypothetical protein
MGACNLLKGGCSSGAGCRNPAVQPRPVVSPEVGLASPAAVLGAGHDGAMVALQNEAGLSGQLLHSAAAMLCHVLQCATQHGCRKKAAAATDHDGDREAATPSEKTPRKPRVRKRKPASGGDDEASAPRRSVVEHHPNLHRGPVSMAN